MVLTITEEQIKGFQALREAFEKEAAALLGSATAFDAAEKKLNELADARRTKAEATLTAEQTAKLNTLVGKPFVGTTRSDRLGGFGPVNLDARRAATFGKYSTELNMLARNKSIQEELKLSAEQIKKATEKYSEVMAVRLPPPTGNTDAYAKAYSERSKLTEEALGKILNEDQAKRFRQLMLQSRERGPNLPPGARTTVIASAVAYPGVAEALKLTEEQKKKLIAGAAPAEVLTDGQKSAIKEMLGELFKGEFTTPFGGTRPPQAAATIRLFVQPNKPVEEALKLTAEQEKAIAAAREAYQKAILAAQPGGPGANFAEYVAAQQAAFDNFDKAVKDVLTADQQKRLAQIVIQSDAAADLGATLAAPEMAKKLELTKEQTEKITAIGEEATKLQGLRTTHVSFGRDQKLGLQMRDAADDRMMAVLTNAQKTKWKEIIGDPVTGLTKSVPGWFGPGGGFGVPGGVFGAPGGFGGPGGGFVPGGP